jgi:hypothetical protein
MFQSRESINAEGCATRERRLVERFSPKFTKPGQTMNFVNFASAAQPRPLVAQAWNAVSAQHSPEAVVPEQKE